LSTVILDLAPVLGKDSTIDVLLPQFLKYLKDPSSQVRLNVISNLEAVNKVVLLKTLSQSLLPAIRELSTDKTWRVRQSIISFTPQLARQLGADVFDEHPELSELCLKWLDDPVFAVREAAADNLKKLCETFGPAWADRILVSRLLTLHGSVADNSANLKTGGNTGSSNSFQHRMTVLNAMGRLGEAIGPAVLSSRLLPAITALARDSVPNVRFTVARALHKLITSAKASEQVSVKSLVRPCLTTLSGDSDADVRYYAQKALNSV
jgi:serine/threonine-protein phosphatase 2A regulatory subunit A